MGRAGITTLACLTIALCAVRAQGQSGAEGGRSVGAGSGPVSELSTNVTTGSRSVGEGSLTVREGSVGSMKSGPVRDSTTPSMISGPVTEVSRGPVTSGVPVGSGVSVREASMGAVTWEARRPVGVPIIEPEEDLAELQHQLRVLREQAELELASPEEDRWPELDAEEDGEAVSDENDGQ